MTVRLVGGKEANGRRYDWLPYWRIKGDEGGKQLVIFHVFKRGGFYLSVRTPLVKTRKFPFGRCLRFRLWLARKQSGIYLGVE